MNYYGQERRRYSRYDTDAKIYFRVNYELKTRLKFQVVKGNTAADKEKYPALSRDISAEGLGFCSDKKLKKGEKLYLEVYLPKRKKPVCMTGSVRWAGKNDCLSGSGYKYSAGVKLFTVAKKDVPSSIHIDKDHGVVWSIALESIFGTFRKVVGQNKKRG